MDPDQEHAEQYLLHEGKYDLQIKADTGEIKRAAITGLVLPVEAIFDANRTRPA